MILYFSAEGNTRYAAERLGSELKEEAISIISKSPGEIKFKGESLGIMFPVYSWGVPPIMIQYLHSLSEQFVSQVAGHRIWMVCTFGDDIAMAPEMLKKALKSLGLELSGGWNVQMPNTYVALPGFDVDKPDVEKEKLKHSVPAIDIIAKKIKENKFEESYVRGSFPRFKSGIIYPLFKKWGITPSKWISTDGCVGCGICEKVCQINNIKMVKGRDAHLRPEWGDKCISCMACYHSCPRHAIEYGNITKGKGQYLCPDSISLGKGF